MVNPSAIHIPNNALTEINMVGLTQFEVTVSEPCGHEGFPLGMNYFQSRIVELVDLSQIRSGLADISLMQCTVYVTRSNRTRLYVMNERYRKRLSSRTAWNLLEAPSWNLRGRAYRSANI